MRKLLLLSFFCFNIIFYNVNAQQEPIGQWHSYMPYNTAASIATDGIKMYVATQYSLYTYGIGTEELEAYSKVNGMSDVGMAKIAYDDNTGAVVLAYKNSNIDILKDNVFYNIPDLKLKSFAGSKAINHIITDDGLAYLSTDVGIVVIDLAKVEIKETYTFIENSENIAVKGLVESGSNFYAATPKGLYRAPKNSISLQDFSEWQKVGGEHDLIAVAVNDNNTVFATQVDSLFKIDNNTLSYVLESDSSIRNITNGIDGIWVIENFDETFNGKAVKINDDLVATDSFTVDGYFSEIIQTNDAENNTWIAADFNGLLRRPGKSLPFGTVKPDGPGNVGNFDIFIDNGELLIAHGGYDDSYLPSDNGSGFSSYINNEWKNYRMFDYAPFWDSVLDITNIVRSTDGKIYAGSNTGGLFILNPDGSYEILKQNSIINPSSTGPIYRVSGLVFDNDGVLWITVLGGTPNELAAITPSGDRYQYNIPLTRSGISNAAAHITVDNANQKWYSAPGSGVIVYDDKHTPENPLDDEYILLRAGEGAGGLPDNNVYSIVTDKDGSVWIGTRNGIGIVSCPGQVIQRQCEAEKRIVQFDEFAGYLFQNELVRTIAVDGANRKWIGTNNGVWLISENGDEIIERFTIENSPLPSNIIQDISIDGSTGEVYIGTEQGLISYRGTAIDGGRENTDFIAYPNPVPSGYTGPIAIKGFVENADVRITDISGQLVHRTTALGGQVVWNGKDYNGNRPQSGVYLIFATNRDGSQTKSGKLVIME